MKKKTVVSTLILSLISFIGIFIYMSFVNSIDCSQLVIDTYELHSNIDIPKVEFVNCYYDKDLNTRISVYDLKEKISLNDFEKIQTGYQVVLKGDQLLNDHELPTGNNIYHASGKRWGTEWTYLVDPRSNRLWAELDYTSDGD